MSCALTLDMLSQSLNDDESNDESLMTPKKMSNREKETISQRNSSTTPGSTGNTVRRGNNTPNRIINAGVENTLPLCVTDPKNRIPRRYKIIQTSHMMKD